MNKDLLLEKLQNERMVFMEGEFNEENCHMLSKRLIYLYNEDQNSDIILYIDSFGGSVTSFLQIYNLINSFKCSVHTVAMGKAMSGGAFLLLSGSKGKRFAYNHTQIMLHELAFGAHYNKLHDQENRFEYSKSLMKVLYEITSKRTKIKKVEEFLKKDQFMSAKEAMKLGLIDKII